METEAQMRRWIKRAEAAIKNPSLLSEYDNISEIKQGIARRKKMLRARNRSSGGAGG